MIWIFVALIFLVFELMNPGLFLFLSFSIGALAGFISFFLCYNLVIQSLIAFVIALISVIFFYYLIPRIQHDKTQKTNAYALIGKEGVVVKECGFGSFGQVLVGGEIWSCTSVHDIVLGKNTKVRVVALKGAHLIIESCDHRG